MRGRISLLPLVLPSPLRLSAPWLGSSAPPRILYASGQRTVVMSSFTFSFPEPDGGGSPLPSSSSSSSSSGNITPSSIRLPAQRHETPLSGFDLPSGAEVETVNRGGVTLKKLRLPPGAIDASPSLLTLLKSSDLQPGVYEGTPICPSGLFLTVSVIFSS